MSNLLLEFTKKDETELYQDQDIFTISYEIELDTDGPDVWMDRSEYSNSLADLVGDDDSILDDIYGDIETYFDRDVYIDSSMLEPEESMIEKAVRQFFPNFYKKWGDILTFTLDSSIPYGFEMFPTTYLTSINKAFEFLKDFYKDYENQSAFKFNHKTGLHTNIGVVDSDQGSWNYFKGFLFLNDNFATRGFEERLHSDWSSSIREAIMDKIRSHSPYVNKTSFRRALVGAIESNFDAIESAMNGELRKSRNSKEFGFSIRDNRIEFRYPGGDLSIESLKDATLYYAYVVKLITDPQFKRREYLKKATAFVLGMGDDLDQADRKDTNFKNINRALLVIKEAINSNPNPEPLFKISKDVRIQGLSSTSLVDKFLNPNFLSNLNFPGYLDFFPGHLDFENKYSDYSYVKVNSFELDSKTIDITICLLDDSSEEILFVRRGLLDLPVTIKFISGENKNIPIYNFAQAIMSKQAVPVTAEEYAKINLLSDPDKSLKYLERSIPWMNKLLEVGNILEDNGLKDRIFDVYEINQILNSDNFDELMDFLIKRYNGDV